MEDFKISFFSGEINPESDESRNLKSAKYFLLLRELPGFKRLPEKIVKSFEHAILLIKEDETLTEVVGFDTQGNRIGSMTKEYVSWGFQYNK